MHTNFYDLEIWKKGYSLLMNIYSITEKFPDVEKYALTSQLCRSANSIIANIAESHGRHAYADKIRVLYIARGEIAETRSHLAVAYGRKYISKEFFIEQNTAYEILTKQMNAFIKNLSKQKTNR